MLSDLVFFFNGHRYNKNGLCHQKVLFLPSGTHFERIWLFFIPSCCVVVGLLCDGSVGCGWGCRGAPQHGQRGRGGGEYRYSIYICNFFPIRISFLSSVYTSLSLGAIPPPKKKNPESVPTSISWACCDDVYILSFPKISYDLSEACNYISPVEIVDLAASCR